MSDDILRKIRGLLAKADGTDNETEANTFREAAVRLMVKYQIDEAELVASGENALSGVTHRIIEFDKMVARDWKVALLTVLASLHHGRAVNSRPRNRTEKRKGSPGKIHLIGAERDMLLVELLWTSLCLQLDVEAARFVERESGKGVHGKTLRFSFIVGWVNRVCDRLEQLYGETLAPSTSTGLELVLTSKKAAADEYVSQALQTHKAPTPKVMVHLDSVAQGERVGDRAEIGQTKLAGQRAALERGTT